MTPEDGLSMPGNESEASRDEIGAAAADVLARARSAAANVCWGQLMRQGATITILGQAFAMAIAASLGPTPEASDRETALRLAGEDLEESVDAALQAQTAK
jgi:hypothetical protein